jgi:hypothetical protein
VLKPNCFADFKNRLRRTRRDSLDTIKQMKLPEDDEKREREIVEKTLTQVRTCNVLFAVSPCFLLMAGSNSSAQHLKLVETGSF